MAPVPRRRTGQVSYSDSLCSWSPTGEHVYQLADLTLGTADARSWTNAGTAATSRLSRCRTLVLTDGTCGGAVTIASTDVPITGRGGPRHTEAASPFTLVNRFTLAPGSAAAEETLRRPVPAGV